MCHPTDAGGAARELPQEKDQAVTTPESRPAMDKPARTGDDLTKFPARWRKELLAKARADLRKSERFLDALKVHTTGYYRAHVLVVEMHRAALNAMEAVPLTVDELEPSHG